MSAETPTLADLRSQIDLIDKQIQTLLNQRAAVAQQVAEVKSQGAEETLFYRAEREAQILRMVMERNQGPLADEVMARLFREVMSACLALEQPMRVAYLGPEGTFTQAAAIKHFGHGVQAVPLAAIDEVFREVESGAVNYGVVPVENSTEGAVNHTLDSFMESPLKICGEVELRIHHHFLTAASNKAENITRVYSHQQSLAQCRKWLDSHWPNIERVALPSNAEAAKRVKQEWNSAAIAGDMAADLYDLVPLAEKIEDQPDNSTRFLIIGHEIIPPSGRDKTSILVATKNKPGALYELLEPFQTHGVDLTRLETRPSKSGAWSYVFFIDLNGHSGEASVEQALKAIGERANEVRTLGSYPKAVL